MLSLVSLASTHNSDCEVVPTADLHLAPQLCLAPLALALARLCTSFHSARCALALASYLTCMHIALALEARALRIVLGITGDTGWRRACNLPRAHAPC